MANESYSEFVSGLQNEIERDTNIRFGIVEKHSFDNVKKQIMITLVKRYLWDMISQKSFIGI